MDKKSCSEKFRIPPEYKNIQVNFCKNPTCKNYGKPAKVRPLKRGRPKGAKQDTYTKDVKEKKTPHLECSFCNEIIPIRSNKAIHEEFTRISTFKILDVLPSCPNLKCPNHQKDLSYGSKCYSPHGKTPFGANRYRCKLCNKTFSIPAKTTFKQKKPHLNRGIFKSLVEQTHLGGICNIHDISYKTLYGKIDWLYKRCVEFAASRENILRRGFLLPKLYIGVDRQFYTVNWTNRRDKKNVFLHAIGSADNLSRYVFGMHLDYDPSLNLTDVQQYALQIGDIEKDKPFRKYARIWLPEDFESAILHDESILGEEDILSNKIRKTYKKALLREDVEEPEIITEGMQLPHKGVQVRSVYSIYAHFMYLKQLLKGAEKLRFFMDQESGIRGACLSVFYKEIIERKCDAYFIQIDKKMTDLGRLNALMRGRKAIKAYMMAHPGLTNLEARREMLIDNVKKVKPYGSWNDRWFKHPFPTKKEPKKKVSHLTDIGDYDIIHRAWLFNKASTHMIDNYFQIVRRKTSMLERSFTTPSSNNRHWYGYAPYDPGIIVKLLEIFRVYFNFAKKRKQTVTPAMRLGIAAGPVDINDIIYGKQVSGNPIFLKNKRILDSKKDEKKKKPYVYSDGEADSKKGVEIIDEIKTKEDYMVVDSLQEHEYLHDAVLQKKTIFLDTETTGLYDSARIVELSLIDNDGKSLFQSLINPEISIPKAARAIHNISDEDVKNAPTMEMVEQEISKIIQNNVLVIYNAAYDLKLLPVSILKTIQTTFCCMLEFARIHGEWNYHFQSYKWKTLTEATKIIGYKWEGKKHRAFSDTLACRSVWQYVCKNSENL